MRVDVHTHVWPERIAETVRQLTAGPMKLEMAFRKTVDGIKAHMRESGVDKSVVLGIVERADQVTRANDWLMSI